MFHWLVKSTCRDRQYGARPLRRAIQTAIDDAISGIVYDDDARIVFETARKVFTLPDEPPRASISVTQLEAL